MTATSETESNGTTDAGSAANWFDEARFGMFVHWDHASQQGLELSWPLVGGVFALPLCQSVSVEQYHSSAATFDPRGWDPRRLARLARETGMGYVVLTAKHHSGYALWHTRESDFSIEHSPYGSDIVAGFVEAVRDEGLRVGLYFSLSDWHHPDYPPFRESDKPYVVGASPPAPSPEQWERYLVSMTAQITELLTNYGQIDLLWFDGGWERSDWQATRVEETIRRLQPSILLNDRLPGVGDVATPEQFVPDAAPDGRWETCLTMNHSWGWNPEDTDYKSARSLVHTLCEVAGRGGNLLLNVSPQGDGTLPRQQIERLEALGRWMAANGDSIRGTASGLEPHQFYGPSTTGAGVLYLHLLLRPYDSVDVRSVPVRRIRSVRELATGRALSFRVHTGLIEGLMPDPHGTLTIEVPSDVIGEQTTVIALEVD
jgi:alpha-L-fucosidase